MIFLLCNAIRHTVLKGVKTKMSKESKAEKKAAKAEKKAAKKANKQPASPEIVKAAVSAITAVICVVAIVLTSVSITNKICETNLSIAKENPASNGSVVNGDVDPGTVDPDTPADPGAVDPDTPADPGTTDPATPADPGTTDPATPSGGNSGSGSGTANNSSAANTSTGAPVGKDIAKIVAYYNAAANATKAYKGTMKLTIVQGSTTKITETSFKDPVKDIGNKLLPNDYPTNKTFTVKNGQGSGYNERKQKAENKSINDILPIDGNPKMSTLVAAGVQSASCSKVSNGYKVVIKLKAETVTSFSQKPKHHSSCMDVLDITDEDIKPFTADSMNIKYTGATLTAVINDKNMLASFNVNEPMHITGNLAFTAIKGSVVLDASWKQDVKFAY